MGTMEEWLILSGIILVIIIFFRLILMILHVAFYSGMLVFLNVLVTLFLAGPIAGFIGMLFYLPVHEVCLSLAGLDDFELEVLFDSQFFEKTAMLPLWVQLVPLFVGGLFALKAFIFIYWLFRMHLISMWLMWLVLQHITCYLNGTQDDLLEGRINIFN